MDDRKAVSLSFIADNIADLASDLKPCFSMFNTRSSAC
jgi:hypothetical protein